MNVDVLIPTLDISNVKVPECLAKFRIVTSSIKGMDKARNDLAKRSKAKYLLYVDSDVCITRDAFEKYVLTAIKDDVIIAYEGEGHHSVCTRVFGVPRNVLFLIGGFDESFDIGEDQEIGYRLKAFGFPIRWIPKMALEHREHSHKGRWKKTYRMIARLALRYKKPKILFLFKRKSAPFGMVFMVFSFFFYFFRNRRKNIDFSRRSWFSDPKGYCPRRS